MRSRLTAIFKTLVLLGLAPIAALAAVCGDYELTEAQQGALQIDIVIPDGEVAAIQRCDVDGNNAVDIIDIRAISRNRNQPSAHPDDPMDWDRNNEINILDARGCQRACALPRCAVQTEEPEEMMGGVTDDAQCLQKDNFFGDASDDTEDFVGIFEYTGDEKRVDNWNLQVVILLEDENGEIQNTTYPFSGQTTPTNGTDSEVLQHLSVQPAGTIDLHPGSVTIDRPGVVSYRRGVPQVLYYWKDGQISRALYWVND